MTVGGHFDILKHIRLMGLVWVFIRHHQADDQISHSWCLLPRWIVLKCKINYHHTGWTHSHQLLLRGHFCLQNVGLVAPSVSRLTFQEWILDLALFPALWKEACRKYTTWYPKTFPKKFDCDGLRATQGKSIVTQREPQAQHFVDKSDPLIKVGDYESNQCGDY